MVCEPVIKVADIIFLTSLFRKYYVDIETETVTEIDHVIDNKGTLLSAFLDISFVYYASFGPCVFCASLSIIRCRVLGLYLEMSGTDSL